MRIELPLAPAVGRGDRIEVYGVYRSTATIDLGTAPSWGDLLFALTVSTVAFTSLESASGLAGEVRVSRTELKRLIASATASLGVRNVMLTSTGPNISSCITLASSPGSSTTIVVRLATGNVMRSSGLPAASAVSARRRRSARTAAGCGGTDVIRPSP